MTEIEEGGEARCFAHLLDEPDREADEPADVTPDRRDGAEPRPEETDA